MRIDSARYFWSKTNGPSSPVFFLFPKQGQSYFLRLVQWNQLIFNFMNRALCKRDWRFTNSILGPTDARKTWQWGSRGLWRNFFWSRSRWRVQKREALVSRVKDKRISNSCHSIMSGRGFATGIIVSGVNVSMNSLLDGMALWNSFYAAENCV